MQASETTDAGVRRTYSLDLGNVTPNELARCLADADANAQARFFSEMGRIMEEWGPSSTLGGCARDAQFFHITGSPDLTDAGRRLMNLIGEHSNVADWYTDEELASTKQGLIAAWARLARKG